MEGSSDAADDDGWFPLLSAVEAQDVALVQSLLDDGADPDRAVVAGTAPQWMAGDYWIGTRPLLWAAMRGHAHIAEALLERATLNLGNAVSGETAVCLSVRHGHLDVLRLLAARGADLNLVRRDGDSPTCIAAEHNHVDVVRFLLDNAAEQLNQSGDCGATPTYIAAQAGHVEVLRLLVDRGADINRLDIEGASPASMAAEHGHLEVLRVLVDNHADVNRADKSGQTPTFMAAQNGHHEVLRLLHRSKARLHEPTPDGRTPLHTAAFNGRLDIVYYLARHGADLAHLDNEGTSAVDLARFEGKIATLLEAVQSAGGWRTYIARLRLPYCLIRHEVSRTGIVCPVNEDEIGQQGLYHFVFGARDEVVEQGPAVLRAAPDDVFAVIGSFLGVRLTD